MKKIRFYWQNGFTRHISYFLVLLIGLAKPISAGAQQKPASVTTVQAPDDRAPMRVRYPVPNRLKEYQTDRDYQYGRDVAPPDNPFARFIDYLYRRLANFLSSEAYQNFWQYVVLACIAGLVIYLLLKAEVFTYLFPKKAMTGSLDYEDIAENIHEINFDQAIEEAINQRSFRLAVRLLYLQSLKRLTDAGLIQYKPDKTNRQYVSELAGSPLQADFERLTQQFEFVWYGDFPVDEARFLAIRDQFRRFNSSRLNPVNA
ncbi:DUF4129 domain-containing protein [Spirosoma fluminis]